MHCMQDLETLDTSPASLIMSIGAVAFDNEGIKSEFYKVITITDDSLKKFSISAATLNWWFKQKIEAIQEFSKSGTILPDALFEFSQFFNENSCKEIWGNGSDFDNIILKNAYDTCGIQIPWRYSNHRCYRTVKAMFPQYSVKYEGVAHNALDDARNQANHLIMINKELALNIL